MEIMFLDPFKGERFKKMCILDLKIHISTHNMVQENSGISTSIKMTVSHDHPVVYVRRE